MNDCLQVLSGRRRECTCAGSPAFPLRRTPTASQASSRSTRAFRRRRLGELFESAQGYGTYRGAGHINIFVLMSCTNEGPKSCDNFTDFAIMYETYLLESLMWHVSYNEKGVGAFPRDIS